MVTPMPIMLMLMLLSALAFNCNAKNNDDKATMDEEKNLVALYNDMYSCMIRKDTVALEEILTEDFVLVHMTGMHQSRHEYLRAIANGTLNYYSCENFDVAVKVDGDKGEIIGKSNVEASVFGGRRHTWRLKLEIAVTRGYKGWKIAEIRASTY